MTAVDDLTRTGARRLGRGRVRAGRHHPRRRRRARGLRLVHDHRARSARGARASAARARCSTSSRAAGSAPVARCRSTPPAAGCRTATPGQFGVLLLVEAVRQLRGECGRPAGARRPRSPWPTAPAASCPPTPPSCWGWTGERPAGVPRAAAGRRHRRLVGRDPRAPAARADVRRLRARPAPAAGACAPRCGAPTATSRSRPRRAPASSTRAPSCTAHRDPASRRPTRRPGPARRGTDRPDPAGRRPTGAIGDRCRWTGSTCPTAAPCRSSTATAEEAPMDFDLDEDQREFRALLRSFVDREIIPVAREWEQAGPLPDRDRRGHGRHGAVRHHRPRGVRRPGPRPGVLRARLRGDRPRAGWASPASSAATRWRAG